MESCMFDGCREAIEEKHRTGQRFLVGQKLAQFYASRIESGWGKMQEAENRAANL